MARPHVRDFLERFVRPLVAGGELHIGPPIPPPDVDRWEQELGDASSSWSRSTTRAPPRSRRSSCGRPLSCSRRDELALAAGLHDALFLVHPRAERWSVSNRQRRRIIDTALTLVSQPLTRRTASA